jgi:hypothetical protein
MLHVSVNIIGEYSELDSELSEPYKQEFEDVSEALTQAGLNSYEEPETLLPISTGPQHSERISVHCLHRLRAAYAAMRVVRVGQSGDQLHRMWRSDAKGCNAW